MSFARRQDRVRILDALESRARQFRTDEDLYPIRIPREPVDFASVLDAAQVQDARFDPLALRSKTLLWLAWEDGSTWELWVLSLPSGLKLFCDTGEEGTRVLASGGRHQNDETERQFLTLLGESAGHRFEIEMSGGAPVRVRSSIADRAFLVDVFTELFEVTGAEASLHERLAEEVAPISADGAVGGKDFRADVARWLGGAMRR